MKELLRLLADGQIHSGEDLARALGVSRTAVWKQLQRLDEQDVRLERVRGQGYRIPGGIDLLDALALGGAFAKDTSQPVQIEVMDSLGSTNNYLMELEGPIKGYRVCLAERQTAGRGRRGRQWQSPFARNLYMSLAFERDLGFQKLSGLSLVAGVAVVRALEELGVQGLALKWPNDIWLDGNKLAGILVELQGEFQATSRVVIGLGLNVHMRHGDAEIDQAWTSLALNGVQLPEGRTGLATAVLRQILVSMEGFIERGFGDWMESWQRYDALYGQEVVTLPNGDKGIARGVDADGAYLIESEAGVTAVNAGEISLRPVP